MNTSILTMLAAPYVLFAGLCALAYQAVRRARREQSARTAAAQTDRASGPTDPPLIT